MLPEPREHATNPAYCPGRSLGQEREARADVQSAQCYLGVLMKAAVLYEQPGRLEIDDLVVDKPDANEVLVRVVGAGLCHSDLHFMEGTFRSRLPIVMGHESAGIVEQVGSDVTYCKPGDHVICCLSIFCGQCRHCLSGIPTGAPTRRPRRVLHAPPRPSPMASRSSRWRLGGFAEMMLVHQNGLVKVTDDVPLDRAALIGCGILTARARCSAPPRWSPDHACA
jgi:S-(hydroxymethyl)glutathione dehydrogenase/alcohol dehydrogenase